MILFFLPCYFYFMKISSLNFLFTWLTIMTFLLTKMPLLPTIYSSMSYLTSPDLMSFLLLKLTLFLYFFFFWFFSEHTFVNSQKLMIMKLLCLKMTILFSMKTLIMFYIFYELSLIPIFLLILGFGYQPERKFSSLVMLLYTLIFSFPLLWAIMFLTKNFFMKKFFIMVSFFFFSSQMGFMQNMFSLLIMLAFLVKLPMFALHMWLPKAHVEAPVEGSMVLASIMLKLAVLGMMRFSVMFNVSEKLMKLIFMISIAGGTMASFMAIKQIDLKSVIAYSSICHMSLLVNLIYISKISIMKYMIIISLLHGLISPYLFYFSFFLYKNNNSRNYMLNCNLSGWAPTMSAFLFLALIFNMSAPPSLTLLAEIHTMFYLFMENWITACLMCVYMYTTLVFNIMLYVNLSKGADKNPALKFFNSVDMFSATYFLSMAILVTFSISLF